MIVRPHLLAWQWRAYASTHKHPANLIIHLVTAPLFWLGLIALIAVIAGASPWYLLVTLGGVLAVVLAQRYGHKREVQSPSPFLGFGDFASRIVMEQLVTFPRYVITGGWWRAFRAN